MIGLILAADLSTQEKTATFAPIAAFIVLAAYKRQILRWVPVAIIVLIPVIHFAAPGALGGIGQILPTSSSGERRLHGRAGLRLPRGRAGHTQQFGSRAGLRNHGYPELPVTTGSSTISTSALFSKSASLGLLSYLAIVVFGMATAHGVIRRGGVRAPPALAASAGCAAFGLLSATYDAAAFPQAVYSFLFVAGLVAALASKTAQPQLAPGRASHGEPVRSVAKDAVSRFTQPDSLREGIGGISPSVRVPTGGDRSTPPRTRTRRITEAAARRSTRTRHALPAPCMLVRRPATRKFHGKYFVLSRMVLQLQRKRALGCRP